MIADVGVGAWRRDPARGVVMGSSSTGVWKPCGEVGDVISGEESWARGAIAAPTLHKEF